MKNVKTKGPKIWGEKQNGMLGLENEIEVLVPSKPPRIKKQPVNEK